MKRSGVFRGPREISRKLCWLSWLVGVVAFALGSIPGVRVTPDQYYFLLPFLGLFVANYFGRRYTIARHGREHSDGAGDPVGDLIGAIAKRADRGGSSPSSVFENSNTRSENL